MRNASTVLLAVLVGFLTWSGAALAAEAEPGQPGTLHRRRPPPTPSAS